MRPTVPRLGLVIPIIATALLFVLPAAGATAAASRRERCLRAAAEATGREMDPGHYRVVTGPSSTFVGGPGDDRAGVGHGGTFVGGAGDDRSPVLRSGTFEGGQGNDVVEEQDSGRFLGGAGSDEVAWYARGRVFSLERCSPADGHACP